jgi:hypothetical protein
MVQSSLFFIGSILFTSSIVLLYLDDLKLSNIKLLKYIQIFSFICIPLFSIIYIPYTLISDIINYAKDNNDINLHGHVTLDKEAGKDISQGMQTIGSNIGLGASIAGIATAVGKTIAKSSVPPVQKAGIILGASIVGGLVHSSLTAVNRNSIMQENIQKSEVVSDNKTNSIVNDPNITKFVDDNTFSIPLQDLLLNIEITNYVCISMVVLLIIQLLFKLHIKNDIKLNLSYILGNKYNNILEFYINKIIMLNQKISTIYIWLIIIILIVGLYSSIYFIHILYTDIDSYVNVHINLNK